jgi:FkbH-like protein
MGVVDTTLRWEQIRDSGRPARLRLAVLSSFTVNPLVPCLGVALEDDGLPTEIFVGPYDQIAQECLSDGATARFCPHILLCWPRLEDLWQGDGERGPAALLELADLAAAAAARWQARLVFVLPAVCETRPLGAGDASHARGVFATSTAAREALRAKLAAMPGSLVCDLEEAVREVGTAAAYNPRLYSLARIPFSQALFEVAGRRLARTVRLGLWPARKVVVVDGDNTLWGGVVGEDGADGVNLRDNGPGAAHREFQAFLGELRSAGALLAVASKNDEADVWSVFARREMVLKKEDLAAWRIGWQPKSTSLREIAEELGVGTDSLVFIDDSPAELAEVQAALPEVGCIRFPEDAAFWMSAVTEAGLLDRLPPTDDDRRRAAFYREELQRKEERHRAGSIEDYLARLGVSVSFLAPTTADLARFCQLVNKTNQFNLNQRRRSEAELRHLCATDRYAARLVTASDRFGDYGVVGAFIVETNAEGGELDSFLLSCRAMGRGVEDAMVAYAFEEITRGAPLVATVLELPRNEPARRFFATLGCEQIGVPTRLTPRPWPAHVARG